MAKLKVPNGVAAQPQANGPRQRILRIGILLGGKLVEERLIRERTTVTVGQSMKNTFSVPAEGLPLEFPMFAMDQGKYYLRFLGNMDGRLSDGGNVHTLDVLKQRGAQNQGGYWQVPLADNARGKLSVGDLTVLFQFVAEPPRQPKPMLPASVRGTFADRFDPRLSVILGASIIIHFAIVIIALTMDVEAPTGIAERAYSLTFDQQKVALDEEKPKPTTDTTGDQGKKAEQPKPKAVQTPAPKRDDNAGREDKEKISLKQQEDAKAFADLLTREGPNGTTDGDISRRRPGSDLNQQISAVKEGGKQIAVGGGAGRGSRESGDPRVGTGKGPDINGPGGTEVAGGQKVEHAPTGRISVSDKTGGEDTTLSPEDVLRKIQNAYMAGIQRCYKNYLVKDAMARGKVTLSLSINGTGRTVKGAAHGFASEIDQCISAQMASWRFPIPKNKDGTGLEGTDTADFAITLQLVPD
jgi:hypothetical protein